MARSRKLGQPEVKGGRRKTGRLQLPHVAGGRRRGLMVNGEDGRQAVLAFTAAAAGSGRVLREDGSFVSITALVPEAGYWSPLVLSLAPGDSEMVLSDTGAPYMIWVPTA